MLIKSRIALCACDSRACTLTSLRISVCYFYGPPGRPNLFRLYCLRSTKSRHYT